MSPKQKPFTDKKSRHLISWVSLLLGFADAFWLYMSSSYLREASGSDSVGLFYGVVFLCVLGILLTLHTWVRWLGKTTLLGILLFLLTIATLTLSALPVSWIGMGILGVVIVSVSITWVVLDIILEDFSSDSRSGRIRGWHLTLMNLGILAGPFAASQVISRVGFWGIFLVSGLIYMVIFLWATLGLRSMNLRFKQKIVLLTLWHKVRRTPNILRIYGVSFALELFYVVMIIYMPLRLLDLGFHWDQIGYLFTMMLIPFVVLQYPLGIVADTRWGEKELLLASLVLLVGTMAAIAVSESHSFWFWAGMLFATRVGAATIEVLRDAYFYKQIDGEDGDLIAFFRTARPIANILTAIIAVALFVRFPLSSVFILSVLVFIVALWSTFSLHDTAVIRTDA
jgi:MFS family permease